MTAESNEGATPADAPRRRTPWRGPLGVVVVTAAVLAGWPVITQGTASGDGNAAITGAATLTLAGAARHLDAYQSAAGVIARRAVLQATVPALAEGPAASGTTGAALAPLPATTGGPSSDGSTPTTVAPTPTVPTVPTAEVPSTTVAAPAAHGGPILTAPEVTRPADQTEPTPTPAPAAPTPAATAAPVPAAVAAAAAERTVAAPAPVAVSLTAGSGVGSSAEVRLLELVNGLRTSMGLSPLAGNGALAGSARSWAQLLAGQGALAHQDLNPFLSTWFTAGENVAFGPSVDSVFAALVSSPRHYANMTRADFTVLGVGVAVAADGKVWTSQLFAG